MPKRSTSPRLHDTAGARSSPPVLGEVAGPAFPGREQGEDLQEVRGREVVEQLIRAERGTPLLPVVAQIEVVSRVGRRQQLEDRQRHAARIDLLEHLADSLLRRRPGELDRRHAVSVEGGDHCLVERDPGLEPLGLLTAALCEELQLPRGGVRMVEDDVERKYLSVDLLVQRGDIEYDVAAERLDDTDRRDGHDGVLAVAVWVDTRPNVGEVSAGQVVSTRITSTHRAAGTQGEIERRDALLTVEEQELRLGLRGQRHTLDKPRFELHVRIPGAKSHHRPDRVRQRHRGQQARDVVVVPDPASLEIWQLQCAVPGLVEQVD